MGGPPMCPYSPAKHFLREAPCIVKRPAAEHQSSNPQVATLQVKAAAAEAVAQNADIATAAVAVANDTVREGMEAIIDNSGITLMLKNPTLMCRWQRCRQRPQLQRRQR
jgi:hypothetical protein